MGTYPSRSPYKLSSRWWSVHVSTWDKDRTPCPIEDADDRQRIALVIKETATPQRPAAHSRLPPEDTHHPPTRRIQERANHRPQKLHLAGGSFGPRRKLPYVFSGAPVVRRLDNNDVLVVRFGHELQIIRQLVDTAVPPRIVRLADYIEGDV